MKDLLWYTGYILVAVVVITWAVRSTSEGVMW